MSEATHTSAEFFMRLSLRELKESIRTYTDLQEERQRRRR
jgi:hypothetical protein